MSRISRRITAANESRDRQPRPTAANRAARTLARGDTRTTAARMRSTDESGSSLMCIVSPERRMDGSPLTRHRSGVREESLCGSHCSADLERIDG